MNVSTLPVIDVVSRPFWDGARAGKLRIQRCPVTGRHQWYPRAHSIHAPGAIPEWVDASGRGKIFSFSTIHRGNGPIEAPYVCALILLEEGVLMLSRIDGVADEDFRIGMPVEVAFLAVGDDLVLPVFRRAEPHS